MARPRQFATRLIPLAIGALFALAVWGVLASDAPLVRRVQLAVSDWLMLREGGPRLAGQQASSDVVLVVYDQKSASALKALPTHAQDIELYRQLLAAGARLVADTRMIADAGDGSSGATALLDAMAELAPSGKLYRDVWLAGNLPPDVAAKYQPYVAHHLINLHPNEDPLLDARLYPLLGTESDGVHESLPLVLARQLVTAGDKVSAPPPIDLAKQCGIAAVWQRQMPEKMSLPAAMRADDVLPSEYPLAGRAVPWQTFRSRSPLVPPSAFWISHNTLPQDWQRLSYVDALGGLSDGQLAGKTVLVGYDAAVDPTSDTYAVPTGSARASAVEVAAAAVETLARPHLMRIEPRNVAIVVAAALAMLMALVAGLLRPVAALVVGALLIGAYFVAGTAAYRAGWLVDLAIAPAGGILAASTAAGWRYWREVRVRMRIVDLFGRYVPRAVVTQLVQQPDAEALTVGGVKREVTVLFADIRGFTSFSERFPPEDVLEQLNSLLKVMVGCTFANEGTLDKFIGDAILVLFNAPLDQPDHALRAARTAWAIQQGIAGHASGLSVGIGIHRGVAVVGRIGTPERMEYTAVGSTVNVASRLCSAAGPGQIIVSEAVMQSLGTQFELDIQPPIRVKGIEGELATAALGAPRTNKAS